MTLPELLRAMSQIDIPVLQVVFWATIVFWIFFSLVMSYHWLMFNQNKLVAIGVLTIYFLGSLTLLGLILTTLSYVS